MVTIGPYRTRLDGPPDCCFGGKHAPTAGKQMFAAPSLTVYGHNKPVWSQTSVRDGLQTNFSCCLESYYADIIDENFRSSKLLPVAKKRRVTASRSSTGIASLSTVSCLSMRGVTNSRFSEKDFIRGYCEPLGGLGYFCVPHKPLNLTWTTETDQYHATNVYFKCPCEDSLVCTGTTGHCGPRTGST